MPNANLEVSVWLLLALVASIVATSVVCVRAIARVAELQNEVGYRQRLEAMQGDLTRSYQSEVLYWQAVAGEPYALEELGGRAGRLTVFGLTPWATTEARTRAEQLYLAAHKRIAEKRTVPDA